MNRFSSIRPISGVISVVSPVVSKITQYVRLSHAVARDLSAPPKAAQISIRVLSDSGDLACVFVCVCCWSCSRKRAGGMRGTHWSVPRKNWTGNKSFPNRSEWFKTQQNNSGRGQADDSLPGSGAGSPGCARAGKEAGDQRPRWFETLHS